MQGRLIRAAIITAGMVIGIPACSKPQPPKSMEDSTTAEASAASLLAAGRDLLRKVREQPVPGSDAMPLSVTELGVEVRDTPPIPLRVGLSIGTAVIGDYRGDYEYVETVSEASAREIVISAHGKVADVAGGTPRDISFTRAISRSDLDTADVQVLGFDSTDPREMPGTTLLGPSRALFTALRTRGHVAYALHNNDFGTRRGTITRVDSGTVLFSVLLNGRRVALRAIRAIGLLTARGVETPWELWFLDDPANPILLKVARGGRDGGFPVEPEWQRQIVRFDAPDTPENREVLEKALETDCRVEVPGIYFGFNSASLDQASQPALRGLGELLTLRTDWRVVIEGHTDSIGTDAENRLLSARRASAVSDALISQHRIAAARLAATGLGESRPRESNATPEGRARNRRVELVRSCAK